MPADAAFTAAALRLSRAARLSLRRTRRRPHYPAFTPSAPEVPMGSRIFRLLALFCVAATSLEAQSVAIREWPVEWQGRPRDPDVDPRGRVWFVGQTGNYIGMFDPHTASFRRFELEENTLPHNLVVAPDGGVWYAGNGNGRIGRLDPATGESRVIRLPDDAARDPHTLLLDGRGNVWFTVQNGAFIGRLGMESGAVELIGTGARTRPYGITFDSRGHAWVNLFGTNRIASVDPTTFRHREIATPREAARTRRIAVTRDDAVWYTDFAGGRVGRIDPATGDAQEWVTPGGERSQPYAMIVDDRDRIWYSECARGATFLTAFDPRTEQFVHRTPVSSCIRHMVLHAPTRRIWFGTDANNIGRIELP
jgi:virginiamycin B lyase